MKNKGVYYRLALGIFVQALKDYGLPQGVTTDTPGGRRAAADNAFLKRKAHAYLFGPEVEQLLELAGINIDIDAMRERLLAGKVDMKEINFFDPTDWGTQTLVAQGDREEELIEESI